MKAGMIARQICKGSWPRLVAGEKPRRGIGMLMSTENGEVYAPGRRGAGLSRPPRRNVE